MVFFFGGETLANYEDCKLLQDTFSFLMVGRYPFDFCFEIIQKEDEDVLPPSVQKQINNIVATGQEMIATGTELTMIEDGVTRAEMRKFRKANSDFLCLPFWVGLFINISQLFIYTVVIANVFRDDLPANADTWLRLAQIFAVLVTLYTQSDFIDGIFLLTEGWTAFQEVTTCFKFNFSAVLRILSGNFGILSTITLVMYSTEVVDLLLNFTAMEFVATLDGSAFSIASKGFLGITLEKKAKDVEEFRYKRRTRKSSSVTRVFAYTFYVGLVFSAFVVIVYFQSARKIGIDNEVYVQFDDTHLPALTGISGVYKGCKGFNSKNLKPLSGSITRMTGDIGYVDISFDECPNLNKDKEFPAKVFVYCWEHDGWVYIREPTKTPCAKENHLLRSFLDGDSSDSNSFDILTHSKANWLLNRPGSSGSQVLLDFVFIESISRFDSGSQNCSKGLLLTESSGERREYQPLPTNETFYPSFEYRQDGRKSSYYDAFGLLYRQVYWRRPNVTVAENCTQNQQETEQEVDAIFFDGLRWITLTLNPMDFARSISKSAECPPTKDDPDCWRVFVKYFRQYRESIAMNFTGISDPMKFLTPGDTGVPTIELKWFEPQLGSDGQNIVQGKKEAFAKVECAIDLDIFCSGGTALIVDFTTDFYPEESALMLFFEDSVQNGTLQDLDRDVIRPEVGENDFSAKKMPDDDKLTVVLFQNAETFYRLYTCLPKDNDRCLRVMTLDSFSDGLGHPGNYAVSYRDDFVFSGDFGLSSAWGCRSHRLGCGNSTSRRELKFAQATFQSPTPAPTTCIYSDFSWVHTQSG